MLTASSVVLARSCTIMINRHVPWLESDIFRLIRFTGTSSASPNLDAWLTGLIQRSQRLTKHGNATFKSTSQQIHRIRVSLSVTWRSLNTVGFARSTPTLKITCYRLRNNMIRVASCFNTCTAANGAKLCQFVTWRSFLNKRLAECRQLFVSVITWWRLLDCQDDESPTSSSTTLGP